MKFNKDIFLVVLPVYLLALYFYQEFNIWFSLFGFFFIGCICDEIIGHRYFSHKTFKLPRWAENIAATLHVFVGFGGPIWFAAMHRHHHRYSDTDDDLHSPNSGIWNFVLGWYLSQKDYKKVGIRMPDLLRNPYIKFVHRNVREIFWAVTVPLIIISPYIAFNLILLPVAFNFFMKNVPVNLFAQYPKIPMGYRTFETKDNSRNHPILSLLTWGVSLHNNHHRYPERNYFSCKWWEIDIAGLILKFVNWVTFGDLFRKKVREEI